MITTMDYAPTDEQQAIVDSFLDERSLAIEALAGTRKTTQLKMLGRSAPDRSGLYIAFNREVAAEARASFPGSVLCATGHSIAYRAVGYQYADQLQRRVMAKEVAELLGLKKWVNTPIGRKNISPWKVASLAVQTVQRFCQTSDERIERRHVPTVIGLDTPSSREKVVEQVFPAACRIWDGIIEGDGRMPFSHDVYFKTWSMQNPILDYDYVMVDEAQDTHGALAGVIKNQTTQVIMVGDRNQNLFRWRGTVDIMDGSVDVDERLALSQSFRFGDEIAVEANRWLGYIGHGIDIRGTPSIDSRLREIDAPDVILCRTNADVVSNAMRQQEAGRKVSVVGGTEQIEKLAQACLDLRKDGKTSHHDLSAFQSWGDVISWIQDERPGGKIEAFVRLITDMGPEKIISAARRCTSPADSDIAVSTTHMVKGLEWPSVKVDAGLCGAEEKTVFSKEDFMVAYVACTRAQHELDASALELIHGLKDGVAST